MDGLLTSLADCLLLAVNDDTARDGICQGLVELRDQILTSAPSLLQDPKPKPPPYLYREAPAYHAIIQRFGSGLPMSALVRIASRFAQTQPHVQVDRTSKRRKDLLYKWLDSHYDKFIIFLRAPELNDDDGATIEL
jgi:hypothetical protein